MFLGKNLLPKMRREQLLMEKEDVYLVLELDKYAFNLVESSLRKGILSHKLGNSTVESSLERQFRQYVG